MSLAPIELLPVELIQEIFLLSLNLSLPAASHHIAAKLSHPYIYKAVCDEYLNTPGNSRYRLNYIDTQSRIFRYRWMTWEFFQTMVLKIFAEAGCLCGTSCSNPIWPPSFSDPSTMPLKQEHQAAFKFSNCRLPSKLLHGPFTEAKIEFLRFLLWTTNMTVDWANRETVKILFKGKREAFLTGNLAAVQLFNHTRRLGKAPSFQTVRFAVIEAGCNRSVVYDTLCATPPWALKLDCDSDYSLDMWCIQAIAKGNPKGNWLRIKLNEVRLPPISGGDWKLRLDPGTGDYEAEGDKLIVNEAPNWPTYQWKENRYWRMPVGRVLD